MLGYFYRRALHVSHLVMLMIRSDSSILCSFLVTPSLVGSALSPSLSA